LRYRTHEYPYIQEHLFEPLIARGGPIWHQDLKQDPGVDVVGDLTHPHVVEQLISLRPRTVLCNGCLLHLERLEHACRILESLVPPGGYLCVSTPEIYPFCSDPWDSGFRPSPAELARLFPNLEVILQSSVVQPDASYFLSLVGNPKSALLFMLRLVTPFWKPRNWLGLIRSLPQFFTPYRAACLLMRRRP
jgi:hypothetical protein